MLNKDEIIRMAREAELYSYLWGGDINQQSLEALERFAAIVREDEREKCFNAAMKSAEAAVDKAIELEREACAKVCEGIGWGNNPYVNPKAGTTCAAAIRARGQ